tara:strand:+ start:457 stop:1782 length:1326 start_codon:yes stop_codon:yes gene_type:complete
MNTCNDLGKLIYDRNYTKQKGCTVHPFKSSALRTLERELKNIRSDDPNWTEKVNNMKGLICKEIENNNRYIIRYDKTRLNSDNYSTLGLFRSIVTDGERIISYAPPKSLPIEEFYKKSKREDESCVEFIEGTMINLFYDSEWKIATRSNIGAYNKFYVESSMSFRDMFMEALTKSGLEFDMFSKEYNYSFVMQHPENRIVIPINVAKIILTNIYKCQGYNFQEIDLMDDNIAWISKENRKRINFPKQIGEIIKSNETDSKSNETDITKLQEIFREGVDYTIMGVVICNRKMGIRTKIRNPNYEYVRELKGNSPKLQYQYYNLRKYGRVSEFLKYYPEYKGKFSKLRDNLHDWTLKLWSNYISCYINKDKPLIEFPFEFRNHIFNLHKIYLNELRINNDYISKKVVINYINNLPSDYLMSSINYPLKRASIKKYDNVAKIDN